MSTFGVMCDIQFFNIIILQVNTKGLFLMCCLYFLTKLAVFCVLIMNKLISNRNVFFLESSGTWRWYRTFKWYSIRKSLGTTGVSRMVSGIEEFEWGREKGVKSCL